MPSTKLFPETKLSNISGKLFTRLGGEYDPVSPVIHRRRGESQRNIADPQPAETNGSPSPSAPGSNGNINAERETEGVVPLQRTETKAPADFSGSGTASPASGPATPSKKQKAQMTEDAPLLSGTNISMHTIGDEDLPRPRGQWVTTANTNLDCLDLDDCENEILQQERERRRGHLEPAAWKKWIITFIIAFLTAVVALGIDEGIDGLNWLKFNAVEHYMETPGSLLNETQNPNREGLEIEFTRPFFIFIFINLAYVSVAAALCVFLEPLARGSGIPEIKCYLNGIRINRVVRLKTLIAKATGILFSVASGLPCGKEGPMIHSGAAIASGVCTGKSSKLHWDSGFFREFRQDSQRRNFITAGAAAGVAAAFGAPIGGVLFAVEEVGTFWKIEITVMVFICATVTPWVLQVLKDPAQFTTGTVSGQIDFGKVEGSYHYYDVPFLMLLGAIGGLLGALFIATNMRITKLRKRYVTTKPRKFAEVLIISSLVSMTLIILTLRLYQCVPIGSSRNSQVLEESSSLKFYGCPKGYYNDMATYFFHSLEESIRQLIKTPDNIDETTLLKQLIPYFILTILTYGIHVPSGLFLPSLALGANIGHLYAQVINYILPGAHFLPPNSYSLFGATAMLAGNVRMTISIIVIIMECTANTSFFYPLTIISLSAKFTGDLINHGLYDEHIHLSRIPLLEAELDRPEMHRMRAGDIMNPSIVKLPLKPLVGELIYMLKTHPFHNTLVVVDVDGTFRGLLRRRYAIILVAKRAWEVPLDVSAFVRGDKEREYMKLKKYKTLEVPPEDLTKTLDLLPYIDQWPYTFLATTPAPRLHNTMRSLAVRHMVVIDERRQPIGIVGRKQLTFLEYCTEEHLHENESSLQQPSGLSGYHRNINNVHDLHNHWLNVKGQGEDSEDDLQSPAQSARENFPIPSDRHKNVLMSVQSIEDGWQDSYKKHVN